MNTNGLSYISNESGIATFSNVWREADKIPGYITRNEGLILYMLCLEYSTVGNIIEIGPFHGKSSVIIGTAIVHSNHKNRKLLCIDDFSKQESSLFPGSSDPKQNLLRNIHNFGLESLFELYEKDSADALQLLSPQEIGLVFIDSNHTAKQISREFPISLSILKRGGVILIHDYENPSVERQYSSWIKKNIVTKYNTVYVKDSTPKYSGNGLLIVMPE